MVFVDFDMELHAAPIAKLGARKMESYRLPFWAASALPSLVAFCKIKTLATCSSIVTQPQQAGPVELCFAWSRFRA